MDNIEEPKRLTEEELKAMPIGACVLTCGASGLVYMKYQASADEDKDRWVRKGGVTRSSQWLAEKAKVIPLHLSTDELGAVPTGTVVVDEHGREWTKPHPGYWVAEHHSGLRPHDHVAALRCDRRDVRLPHPDGLTAEDVASLSVGAIITDADGDRYLKLEEDSLLRLGVDRYATIASLMDYAPVTADILCGREIRALLDPAKDVRSLTDRSGRYWAATTTPELDLWSHNSYGVNSAMLASIGVAREDNEHVKGQ